MIAVCLMLLLQACTFSDTLRNDPVRSVWGRGMPPPARTVFFVTDRQAEDHGFGQKWGGALRCGHAAPSIPDGTATPQRPNPALESENCSDAAGMAAFMGQVAQAAKPCGRLLVIVHGYNTGFQSALLQGAQVATDTQWPCATLLFSWSSEGRFGRYAADIERSGFAVPPLILSLRAARAARLEVSILAHSMGARLALSAMGALCTEGASWSANQLILAAPDVGADMSNDDFAHLLERVMPCTRRATVYASDNDLALLTSQSLHGGALRAGRFTQSSLDYVHGHPGDAGRVDVIDAGLAPGGPVGHGYFMLSYEMAHDMMEALAGIPVTDRAGPDGPLACTDAMAACASGDKSYVLVVAQDRQPGLMTRLIRTLWPLSTRVQ